MVLKNINELIRKGKIVVASYEADEGLTEEQLNEATEEEGSGDDATDVAEDVENETDELNEDNPVSEDELEEDVETTEESEDEEKPPHEESTTEVKQLYTLEVLSQVMAKYDNYMASTELEWNNYIVKGKVKKGASFIFVEDMHTLVNNTLDEEKFEFIKIYNQLYDYMTEDKTVSLLALYGRESYGKPFLAEGIALLLYELSVDWAVFMTRYYKETPQLENEEDSFFKRFPNLRFLSYIAYLLLNSEQLKELISKDTIRDLMSVETQYKLTSNNRAKKKALYKLAGENFSYYASLIRYNYADIMVGVLDKLGTIAYLCKQCPVDMNGRLQLITMLINAVSSKTPVTVDTNNTQVLSNSLQMVEVRAMEVLKGRSEATIMLESNEKNYPLAVIN